MIAQLQGSVIEINPTHLILDCNGVGYELSISLNSYTHFQNKKEITIFTQLIVREDAQLLYGFYEKPEKEMFKLLISVSGVGPASALMMLSSLNIQEITQAISNGQNIVLQKVKGIGAKTAQRIIIDLKDKMINFEQNTGTIIYSNNNIKNETLNALEVLGVSKKVAEKQLDIIISNNPDISIENLIKETLKRL